MLRKFNSRYHIRVHILTLLIMQLRLQPHPAMPFEGIKMQQETENEDYKNPYSQSHPESNLPALREASMSGCGRESRCGTGK